MNRTLLSLLLGIACVNALPAQNAPEKPVYTYIADYGIPRANWDEFTARWEKQSVPVLERLLADGTIIEYGASASVVHTPNGSTHSLWWSSMSFAGTQRVLEELMKGGSPAPAVTGMTHRDRLVRSLVNRTHPGRLTSGFTDYSVFVVKPGKAEKWRELYDKYTKPVMERMLEQGTILGYGVDVEQIHTEKMGTRFEWTMYPNAEAVDKVQAAFAAARQATSADERRAVNEARRDVYEPEGHLDGMDRVIRWARK